MPSTGRRRRSDAGSKRGSTAKGKPLDKDAANFLAITFIMMFQGAATQVFGPPGQFTKQERDFIEPALKNILQRLPVRIASQVTMFLDPLMLAFGLGMYSVRMWKLETSKREERQQEQPQRENVSVAEQQVVPTDDRRNGNVPPAKDNPSSVAPIPLSIIRAQVNGDGI